MTEIMEDSKKLKPTNTMRAKVVFGRMGASAPIFFLCFLYAGQKCSTKVLNKKKEQKQKKEQKNKKGTKTKIKSIIYRL
tara:strand:- start:271 stop:507 length:237 start_codon:yes stop_codon:yes gene_type:complete